MTKRQTQNEIDFFFELRVLLDRYDVDISPTRDEMVQICFNTPYGVYEFSSVTSIDDQEEQSDAEFKVE